MLPPNYFTPWGPGALYAELYVGLCRALAAPWLRPWLEPVHAARTSPGAQSRSPSELAAAEPPAAEPFAARPSAAEPTAPLPEAATEPHWCGASIIPFDRARARLSRRLPR
jgi:hypothetical protein